MITTVSGPQKAELAAKAGADLVVNYREPGAVDEIRAFTADAGVDRVVEVALDTNLKLDLAVIANGARVSCYAAEPTDPALPVRACMNANLVLRLVLLYGLPPEAMAQAARDITDAWRRERAEQDEVKS